MIGTMLGNRYEVLEKIGEGGMALVYKSKDHLLNRNVAVKILKEQFSNDNEFVEKFKREATAAASLSNNNIVNIYDVGSQNNINYIVMEYVDGKTLKQVIREKIRIDPSEAVEISIQIAKALECAHKNNIIHRDIKPHNILVTNDGVVKVTDFGIAKASNSVTITNSNKIMGSAHYFSPEQAKGSFVDFRTDIYSLGIVMYEMVTGKVPYDAESPVSVALKHIQEPVVPPKQLNDNIPDSLNKLILKAVEKEPIRRYQTMTDMLADLKKIQNNEIPNIEDDDFEEDMTRVMDPVEIDKDQEPENYEESKGEKGKKILDPKKKRNILAVAIIVMAVVIGSIVGYFYYSKAYGGEAIVPNVVGMKQNEAKKAIEAKKLKFVVVDKEKSSEPKGTVIKTLPKAGTRIKVNSEVRVSISGGEDKLKVPNVVGIDYQTAKDIITNSGLKVGNVSYDYSDNVQSGYIISQDPKSDSNVNKDSQVDLVVSSGPKVKYINVPDVTGKNIDEAASTLSSAGISYTESAENTSDESQDGIVKSQSAVGSQVKEGTTISLVYYKYVKPQEIQDGSGANINPNNSVDSSKNGSGNNNNNGDSSSGKNGNNSGNSGSGNNNNNGGNNNNNNGGSNVQQSNTQKNKSQNGN